MIHREGYLRNIRPFMRTEAIKVTAGIRRCGKSVMLGLIRKACMACSVLPGRYVL